MFDELPAVANDLDMLVDGLSKPAAGALDLIPGMSAAQGGGDAWHDQIGLNVLRPGKMSLMAGSPHVMSGQSSDPVSGPGFFGGYTDGVAPSQYVVEISLVSFESALKWFEDNFCLDINLAAEQTGPNAYNILNQRSADIPIDYDGFVINEFFQDNRTSYSDSRARGVFTGPSFARDREYMYCVIQETVYYGTETNLCKLRGAGFEAQEFMTCGDVAKSHIQTQMHSDVIGIPVTLTEVGDAVTLGSRILTTAGVGLYGPVQEATDTMVHGCERIEPNAKRCEQYKSYADRYCK